ncbi:MAG: helix-turn-helix domain-containing protein [Bacteroidota bacterium]
MDSILHISSVAQIHEFLTIGKPQHPLMAIFRKWPEGVRLGIEELRFTTDLYLIMMKGHLTGSFQYGRNAYDYQEGTMVFIGPGQVATFNIARMQEEETGGWMLFFHPDLIRKSALGQIITQYSYFHYDTNEALHLAEKEKQYLDLLISQIEQEIQQNLDRHSQELMVSHLDTLLKYSSRYYDRQFYTRTNLNQDLILRFEEYLRHYFGTPDLIQQGMPSLSQCGEALHLSGPYLSHLLKLETGKSAKEHIYDHLLEAAKTTLLSSTEPISEVAYGLGFEYPQHFSKLFKQKTGMNPTEYRNVNLK